MLLNSLLTLIYKMVYRPKDFIETAEGLVFAVVAAGYEGDTVRCFLRYIQDESGFTKVDTAAANQYLASYQPQYLFYSTELAAQLHGVSRAAIVKHHQPVETLAQLVARPPSDAVVADVQQLCEQLQQAGFDWRVLGITGSLLLGAQQAASDIDLVCYDRAQFQQLRRAVLHLIASGHCQAFDDSAWQAAYDRRACDLDVSSYVWHEHRKANKALINGRKFDLSLVVAAPARVGQRLKAGAITLTAQVLDDQYAFDYPAQWRIDHPRIAEVLCFTATYTGQAQQGEWISVAGDLEIDANGVHRVIVGSSREAVGQFIKVVG
jgi:predicted nucleotidyltransferase